MMTTPVEPRVFNYPKIYFLTGLFGALCLVGVFVSIFYFYFGGSSLPKLLPLSFGFYLGFLAVLAYFIVFRKLGVSDTGIEQALLVRKHDLPPIIGVFFPRLSLQSFSWEDIDSYEETSSPCFLWYSPLHTKGVLTLTVKENYHLYVFRELKNFDGFYALLKAKAAKAVDLTPPK